MIYIFKGDSTTFADVTKFITFHIQTLLDLSNWKAEFVLGSVTKTINDISSKSFEVILTKEDTAKLLYGQRNGIVKLIDDKGQLKTVTNTIPFEVINKVIENKHEVIDLDIPQSTEIELTLEIGSRNDDIDYIKSVINKPQINSVELVGNKTLDELGIQPKGDYLTKIPSEYVTETELNAKDYATNKSLTDGLADKQDKGNYALKSEIPTKTSDLTNDSNYLTSIPSEYVTESELTSKNYVTNVKLTQELNTKQDKGDYITTPTVVQDLTSSSITLAKAEKNTVYKYGNITSLTVTVIDNSVLGTTIIFTASAKPTINLPSTLETINFVEFVEGKKYVIAIENNVAVMGSID